MYTQPFNVLLFIAGVLSFFVYALSPTDTSSLYLGLGILCVSILNTLIEFYQEYKTAAILESFKNLVPGKCSILRNGTASSINVEEIVEGDILDIKMGDKIGADIRLITANNLKVDNSSITGESEPITKKLTSSQRDILSAENVLLSGNMVVNGEGTGIVIATGDRTALGKIARLTIDEKKGESELSEEIGAYVKRLGVVAFVTSLVFYGVALFNGFEMRDNLVFCVGVFIAFVPQGLPATVTILMTVAAQRMARCHVLVKDLRAVETLGSISVLATDKTGTLTQGKMTCVSVWNGEKMISLLDNEHNIRSKRDSFKTDLIKTDVIKNDLVKRDFNSSKRDFNTSKRDLNTIKRDMNKRDLNKRDMNKRDLKDDIENIIDTDKEKSRNIKKEQTSIENNIENNNVTDKEKSRNSKKEQTSIENKNKETNKNITNQEQNMNQDNNINIFKKLANICYYTNKAKITEDGRVLGDPTECALFEFSRGVLNNNNKHNNEQNKVNNNTSNINNNDNEQNNEQNNISNNNIVNNNDNEQNNTNNSNNNNINNNINNISNNEQNNINKDNKENNNISNINNINNINNTSNINNINNINKISNNKINNNNTSNVNKVKGKVYEMPFNSENKYQLSIFKKADCYKVYVKGAPERILKMCTLYNTADTDHLIGREFEEGFWSSYNSLASEGQRVVAVAEKTLSPSEYESSRQEYTENRETGEYTFVSLIGIVDPPKRGVRNAIMKLRLAGIQVVMITGDHPLTAEYIARKIHIISGKTRAEAAQSMNVPLEEVHDEQYDTEIISGDVMDTLTPAEWRRILSRREVVFARTSPKQKLTIVEKLQSQGHIVGVSGDGVNDSPALKKAHLGISMNETGNEVSKEAASMILLDDNFASIVNGVAEGRLIFVNLKKSVRYILSHITPQVVPFLIFVSLGVPMPMSPLLLMFIDLFTEFFPAFFLAFEPAEGNLMIEQPRKKLSPRNINIEHRNEVVNRDENVNRDEVVNRENVNRDDINIRNDKGRNEAVNRNENVRDNNENINNTNINNNINDNININNINNNNIRDNNINNINNNIDNRDTTTFRGALYSCSPLHSIRKYFGRFRSNDVGETLCDMDLLSWSYLEAGILITIGSLGAFFMTLYAQGIPLSFFFFSSQMFFRKNAVDIKLRNGTVANSGAQIEILLRAQSAYFFSIIIGQAFNIVACKRKTENINRKSFSNTLPFIGSMFGLLIGYVIVYVAFFNQCLFSRPVPFESFFFPIGTGVAILFWDSVRKVLKRRCMFFGKQKDVDVVYRLRRSKLFEGRKI